MEEGSQHWDHSGPRDGSGRALSLEQTDAILEAQQAALKASSEAVSDAESAASQILSGSWRGTESMKLV